jgi:acetyltransferase-like isoleucine patch superfamily enzyme
MKRSAIAGVKTFEFTKIIGLENIEFGRNIIIDDFVLIHAKKKMRIGNHVHIACFSSITGGEEFEIGDFSAISQGCRVLTATDDFSGWGFGNSTIDEIFRNVKRAPIRMGAFCIIGANSVILPGVNVGEGTTVGACSVITRDLDPWGVYIGNRKVRQRNKEAVMKTYHGYVKENTVDGQNHAEE